MGQFDVDIKALRMYSDDLDHYEEQTAKYRDSAHAATVDNAAWSLIGTKAAEWYDFSARGAVEGGLTQSGRFLAGMRGRLVEAAEVYRDMDWQAKEAFDALNKDLEDISRNVQPAGRNFFGTLGRMLGNPYGHLAPPPVLRGDFADFGKDAYARGKESSIDSGGATSAVREVITDGVAFVNECQGHLQQAVKDPLRFLAAVGLGFLLAEVQPLQRVVDAIESDPDALQQAAEGMRQIEEGLQQLRTDFDRVTSTRLTGWNGSAAKAAKARMTDYAVGISAVAIMADLIERTLESTALILRTIRDAVDSILTDLVMRLIRIWIPAIQTAGATMGASIAQAREVSQLILAITMVTVAHLVQKLVALMERIGDILNELSSHFRGAIPHLREKSKQHISRDRKAPRQDAEALKVVE